MINHTTLLICLDLDSGYEVTGSLGLKVKQNKMGFLYRIVQFLLRAIIFSKVKVRDRLGGKCFLIAQGQKIEETMDIGKTKSVKDREKLNNIRVKKKI